MHPWVMDLSDIAEYEWDLAEERFAHEVDASWMEAVEFNVADAVDRAKRGKWKRCFHSVMSKAMSGSVRV